MAHRGESLTLTLDVYDKLRAEILGGQFEPGERVRPTEIGKRFAVGVGVVREALTRLVEQDLVVAEHNRGFRVITLSDHQPQHILQARQLNECRALEISIEKGDINWEGDVVATHHKMVSTPIFENEDAEHSNDAFASAHRAFHFALISACDNPYLLDICYRLFETAELYRRWSAPMLGHRPKAGREHKAIMDASLARNVEEASTLYAEHLATTTSLVLKRYSGRSGDSLPAS